jgi:hypothetical protein
MAIASAEDRAITQAFIENVIRNHGEFTTVLLDRSGTFCVYPTVIRDLTAELHERNSMILAQRDEIRALQRKLEKIRVDLAGIIRESVD